MFDNDDDYVYTVAISSNYTDRTFSIGTFKSKKNLAKNFYTEEAELVDVETFTHEKFNDMTEEQFRECMLNEIAPMAEKQARLFDGQLLN